MILFLARYLEHILVTFKTTKTVTKITIAAATPMA